MTIHWKAVEQYFAVVFYIFTQFNCNYEKFISFGLGNVRREMVNKNNYLT